MLADKKSLHTCSPADLSRFEQFVIMMFPEKLEQLEVRPVFFRLSQRLEKESMFRNVVIYCSYY